MNRDRMFKFRLYVAGGASNSGQAISNLAAFCRDYLPGRSETEVVDVLKQPKRALEDGIFMTPTLLKVAPGRAQRIVGTLSQRDPLLNVVGLDHSAA